MMSAQRRTCANVRTKSTLSKVRPSPEIIAAKRKAAAEQKLLKQQSKKTEDNHYISDIYQSVIDAKKMIKLDTGLIFDQSMAEHRCLWDENYPECPERFTRILERCENLGLVKRCKLIEPRLATHDELLLKHTQFQIDVLKATDECTDMNKLETISSRYDAIYIHPSTYRLSRLATGSTINLLEAICREQIQNGMAIIRPPGHHAMKSEYCGYCFFNNVAIGAEKMLKDGLANKILIVDWDVHHGQATQQMFYNDPRVVYFSIHRYEHGEFWPNLRESDYHYVGDNDGRGYNFNIPLNKTGMTNADYLAIFHQVLMPMAYEFQPDLIIISAGYDAALGCPEGEMKISPAFYPHLLSPLLALANGKVAVILEGGYCLESLSESAALTLRTLLGDPCPMMTSVLELPSSSIRETILNVIYSHRPYWKCYEYQDTYSIHSILTTEEQSESNRHLPAVIFNGDETKPEIYQTRNCYPIQSATTLNDIHNCLITLKQITNLNVAPNRVCLVYDDRMLKHYNQSDATHPESPKRIAGIYEKHDEYDLLKRCYILQGRAATEEDLMLVHTSDYIKSIRETEKKKISDLSKQARSLDSIYFNSATWESACIATGSLLQVVDSVLNGDSQSGVAIIRPPGHHADEDIACGFCMFNNISIAAKYATQHYGLKRVLIVDWDIHHGNGTQSILQDDPKILYISIHRYDNGSFFPHSTDANYDVIGTGKGEGFNINIPWNRKKMSDPEYIAAFQQIIMPIAYQFNPELVLVSAGFDACIGDPLGGYTVSPIAYGHFTHWLSALANGKIILALEGGYNINSISYAMTMCTKSLLGDPLPILSVSGVAPCSSAITTIKNVLKTQKDYWPNLMFQAALPKENVIPDASAIINLETSENHQTFDISPGGELKIVREQWQTEKNLISDAEYKMASLNINKDDDEIKCTKQSVDSQKENKSESVGNQNPRAGSSKENENQWSDDAYAIDTNQMFAIIPLADCPHLKLINDVPSNGINIHTPCSECNSKIENWICLHCYTVNCARNINQHAIIHGHSMEHYLTLSFVDLSVWCYGCEAYIDNPRLHAAKSAVYKSKFNEELPWAYEITQHHD
ncbi:hypothetical protein PV327_006097 [Microctonus hyperodae]|uniref:UBP-type domain-containing protein n=1 Tax=Microctonus hyperodae TaxID=165561 RepID=A0AA39L094_MICHY|nr:hypothetical protein PV327_006097 [Microctonus hyperodae]